jgi:CO dehydrogenase nickel-insertion accessory protein CooC1
MKKDKTIITLESTQPSLSKKERLSVWRIVESTLPVMQPVVSPFLSQLNLPKIMTPLLIVLMLALGGSSTVLASNNARPGDFLFSIDRALEDIQLKLAKNEDKHDSLVEKFTAERMQELQSILDEEITITPSNNNVSNGDTDSLIASSTLESLNIEAHIYIDTSVVKMEFGGKKFYFETNNQKLPELITAVQEKFPMLTDTQISNAITLEDEGRASRPKDRGIVTLKVGGEARINHAVDEFLAFLDSINPQPEKKDTLLKSLRNELAITSDTPVVKRVEEGFEIKDKDGRVKIKHDDDGDSYIEIKTDERRIKIDEQNKIVTIKNSTTGSTSTATSSTDTTGLDFSATAEIFTDTTIVELDFAGDELYITTSATTREGIIIAIKASFPALTTEYIDAELRVKVRNRASNPPNWGLEDIKVEIPEQNNNDNTDKYNDGDKDESGDSTYKEEKTERKEDKEEDDDDKDNKDSQD